MQQREIELIQSSIDNGRIYFPITDAKFFPADSLSERESDGHKGRDVTIRVSSGQRLSPRKSFARYLKEVAARAGDRLLVVRTSDRQYVVTHRPVR
jgi:hypothetical protein